VLGAVPGLALGAAFFGAVSADAIRFLIGMIAIGFVLFQLALRLGWAPVSGEPPGPIGVWAHRMRPEGAFFALTYALRLAIGCKLVFDVVA
jgi:hypothetical protein